MPSGRVTRDVRQADGLTAYLPAGKMLHSSIQHQPPKKVNLVLKVILWIQAFLTSLVMTVDTMFEREAGEEKERDSVMMF